MAPMMATRAATLPSGREWSYEVKWDGYRAQVVKDGPAVSLASRNLKSITRQYPAVAAAAERLRATRAILDGEIVALDQNGRPSFQALHHASLDGLSLVYYAFDLLHLDGRDLTRTPLDERRAALHDVVAGSGLLLSEPLPGTPDQIAAAVRDLGLEGVVAKRRRSVYAVGRRSDAWVKVRFARHQEFVVGGYKPNATNFDSLLVGYYDARRLRYAGKVRSGFTPHLRAELFAQMRPLESRRCPFANLPTGGSSHWGEGITTDEMRLLRWIKPRLVVEVSFAEWTRDGSLRHAAFIGLRPDKRAREVVREDDRV
jgi:bifunctional non-homologous end joining protein LigD